MADAEKYEILVLGSGEAGKWTAWTMERSGSSHRDGRAEMAWWFSATPRQRCYSRGVDHVGVTE
jgi:hypothetical protein